MTVTQNLKVDLVVKSPPSTYKGMFWRCETIIDGSFLAPLLVTSLVLHKNFYYYRFPSLKCPNLDTSQLQNPPSNLGKFHFPV